MLFWCKIMKWFLKRIDPFWNNFCSYLLAFVINFRVFKIIFVFNKVVNTLHKTIFRLNCHYIWLQGSWGCIYTWERRENRRSWMGENLPSMRLQPQGIPSHQRRVPHEVHTTTAEADTPSAGIETTIWIVKFGKVSRINPSAAELCASIFHSFEAGIANPASNAK